MNNSVRLPQWLDNYIFGELGAKYCPRHSDMTNIDDDREKTLNYLGTYFPRSYAEAYCIFGDFFGMQKPSLLMKEEVCIFDFGCGTGGEIVGLMDQLAHHSQTLKRVKIYAFDGNQKALRMCEDIVGRMVGRITVEMKPIPVMIEDFYDMSVLEKVIGGRLDIFISFKAICEFVSKERFERGNAYSHVLKTFLPKLSEDGIMLIDDVTTYSDVSKEWLPKMMDTAVLSQPCHLFHRNVGYNQPIYVSHSHKSDDVSKVAWRLITYKN